MKFLILLACAVAAASASHVGIYHGPQHLPIINHEGVPVDTASVQHARAAHLSHKATVHHRNGDHLGLGGHGVVIGHGLGHGDLLAHTPVVNHGLVGHGLLGHGLLGHGLIGHGHLYKRSLVHGGLLVNGGHAGLLVDGGLGHGLGLGLGLGLGHGLDLGHGGHYIGPIHLPIINHEGVPVDTASVQHARAAHLSHRANVHARNGDHLGHGLLGNGIVIGHHGLIHH